MHLDPIPWDLGTGTCSREEKSDIYSERDGVRLLRGNTGCKEDSNRTSRCWWKMTLNLLKLLSSISRSQRVNKMALSNSKSEHHLLGLRKIISQSRALGHAENFELKRHRKPLEAVSESHPLFIFAPLSLPSPHPLIFLWSPFIWLIRMYKLSWWQCVSVTKNVYLEETEGWYYAYAEFSTD